MESTHAKNPAKSDEDCSGAGKASLGPEGVRGEFCGRQSITLSTVTKLLMQWFVYMLHCGAPVVWGFANFPHSFANIPSINIEGRNRPLISQSPSKMVKAGKFLEIELCPSQARTPGYWSRHIISFFNPLDPVDFGPWVEILRSILSLTSQVTITGNFSGKNSLSN